MILNTDSGVLSALHTAPKTLDPTNQLITEPTLSWSGCVAADKSRKVLGRCTAGLTGKPSQKSSICYCRKVWTNCKLLNTQFLPENCSLFIMHSRFFICHIQGYTSTTCREMCPWQNIAKSILSCTATLRTRPTDILGINSAGDCVKISSDPMGSSQLMKCVLCFKRQTLKATALILASKWERPD